MAAPSAPVARGEPDPAASLQAYANFSAQTIDAVVSGVREAYEDEQHGQELALVGSLWAQKAQSLLDAATAQPPQPPPPAAQPTTSVAAPSDLDEVPVEPSGPVDRVLHPSGIVPRVDSVNAKGTLGCELDLGALCRRLWNVHYDPRSKSPLGVFLRRPKALIHVFASGRITVTGAVSERGARRAARVCERAIRRAGCNARLAEFQVSNIFGTCHLPFEVRIGHLAEAKGMHYNPERSAKLSWDLHSPRVHLEISAKGSVSISGATRTADLALGFEQAYPVLCQFAVVPQAANAGLATA